MHFEQGTNLNRAKVTNQAAIRRMIYHHGPITRAAIAEQLGLALPTITTNINSMITFGIIHEVENTDSSVKTMGRKANPVDIVADFRYFIGAELTRSFRHLCLTNYRGQVITSKSDYTVLPDYQENINRIALLIQELLDSELVPKSKIAGIGIAVPGIIDREKGILDIHLQYDWFNKPICEDILKLIQFDGPVALENDACSRAFGAQFFHLDACASIASFTYLYVSGGIACPFVLNTANLSTFLIGPGEAGYMVMEPQQAIGMEKNLGTLSSLAGERSLCDSCSKAMEEGKAPILKALCREQKRPTLSQVMQAQASGEKIVSEILTTAAYYLGIAMANIDNFVRPDLMIIDARIFSREQNRIPFINSVHKHSIRSSSNTNRFLFIDDTLLSGALGAAAVAINNNLEIYIE